MQSTGSQKNPEQNHLNKEWWADFFKAGAFLRLNESEVLLWQGPFETCAESEITKKNSNISVAYMNFFESHLELRLAPQGPKREALSSLQNSLTEYQKQLPVESQGLLKASDFKDHGPQEFEKTIQSLLGKIQRGELEKVVPTIFSRCERAVSENNLVSWMLHLLQTPVSLHAFGFWEKGVGIMGATPETLFRRREDKVTTMALAGTMSRKEVGQRNSLLKDPKELHEHELVAKDIEKQLEKWGWVKKSPTKILELPTLLHLQTIMEVDGVHANTSELIHRLHPTPALGVAPRAYGYHWLANTADQQGRRVFGGPVLYHIPAQNKSEAGEELCLVAIRNIQWDSEGCRIGAGCGVVQESLPDREWQELQQKIASVMLMLGIKSGEPS